MVLVFWGVLYFILMFFIGSDVESTEEISIKINFFSIALIIIGFLMSLCFSYYRSSTFKNKVIDKYKRRHAIQTDK